jgi:gas vesicle protein
MALGIILGTVLGASVAMMLAPRPGRETRRSLRARIADIQEHVRLRRHRTSGLDASADRTGEQA